MALRAALALVLALVLALGASAAAAQETPAEVWLVGSAARPSVVRYLRAQLEAEVHSARRVEDARGPLVVTFAHGEAAIAEREGDHVALIRTVALPRGLDTAGRVRLAHALRTVLTSHP